MTDFEFMEGVAKKQLGINDIKPQDVPLEISLQDWKESCEKIMHGFMKEPREHPGCKGCRYSLICEQIHVETENGLFFREPCNWDVDKMKLTPF